MRENNILNDRAFKRFKGNLSFAFAAQIISLMASVLMALVVPKLLGVEEFSYWQLFIFYTSYVGFFHFGLTDGVYLKYGGVEYDHLNKSLIGSQFWLLLLIQLTVSTGLLVYTVMFIDGDQRRIIMLLTAAYIVIANMTWYLDFVFQATNNTRFYSVSVIIDRAFFSVSIIVLILMEIGWQFQLLVQLYLLAKTLSLAYSIRKGKEVIFTKLLPIRETVLEAILNIKIGINLTLSNIASILILGFGRFLVDKQWGITAFGMFSFSLSLTTFLLLFICQVSMVLFPVLRQLSEEKLNQYYYFISVGLGLFLPIFLIAYIPIKYLLGIWLPQYQESFRYLALLWPLCIFDGKMQLLCITFFKVLRKEKILLLFNVLAMALSIILGLLGAYVFNSPYFIIISTLVAVAFRSIISEIYLAVIFGNSIKANLISEIILVIIFIICSWYLSEIYGLVFILAAYIIYLTINKQKFKIINHSTKLLFNRS